jgi:hypothetical protein
MIRKDLTEQCLSEIGGKNTESFLRNNFCSRCQNKECSVSEFSNSLWENRVRTQEYRFFENPNIADPDDPKFETIRKLEFTDLLDNALMREVVNKNNNWIIPSKEEVSKYKEGKLSPQGFSEKPNQHSSIDYNDPYPEEAESEDNLEEELDTDEHITNEDLDIDEHSINNEYDDSREDSDTTDDEVIHKGTDYLKVINTSQIPNNIPESTDDKTVLRHLPRNTPIPIGGIMLSRSDGKANTRPASQAGSQLNKEQPRKMDWGSKTHDSNKVTVTLTNNDPSPPAATSRPTVVSRPTVNTSSNRLNKLDNKKPK